MHKICSACSGSGYYDDTGSPPCRACNGTGVEKEEEKETDEEVCRHGCERGECRICDDAIP